MAVVSNTPPRKAVGRPRRVESIPGYERIKNAGGMGVLFFTTIRTAVTPPFSWGEECLSEMSAAFRRSWFPAVLGMILIATGGAIAWFSPLVMSLGVPDRVATGASHAWITEEADWIPMMCLCGAAGAAMCADMGARKIREELDALRVLGTSPIRALVVPRVIAVTVIAPVVATIGLIGTDIPMFLLWPAYSGHQVTVSGYFTSMWLIRSPADLIWLWIKCAMTGTLVGVVCCYKGMHAKGGSEGVGRAVNEAVLITILGLYVINDVGNTAFYGHFYNLTILRG